MNEILLSYGDHLQPGLYHIHSRFARVSNFVQGQKLVSLVQKQIGSGPVNIVLKGFDFSQVKEVRISGSSIKIDIMTLPLNTSKEYSSRLLFKDHRIQGAPQACGIRGTHKYTPLRTLKGITLKGIIRPTSRSPATGPRNHGTHGVPGIQDKFKQNLSYFKKVMLRDSPPKSLAFLLDRKRKKFFRSRFEQELFKKIEKAWNKLLHHDYKQGIPLMKGTGYGFTPAGDDFIAGFLAGLYLIQNIHHVNLSKIRNVIFSLSRSRNVISDTFISFAGKGLFFERTKDLIFSLLYEDKKRILKNAKRLFSFGETSGADFSTGFILAIKKNNHLWSVYK